MKQLTATMILLAGVLAALSTGCAAEAEAPGEEVALATQEGPAGAAEGVDEGAEAEVVGTTDQALSLTCLAWRSNPYYWQLYAILKGYKKIGNYTKSECKSDAKRLGGWSAGGAKCICDHLF